MRTAPSWIVPNFSPIVRTQAPRMSVLPFAMWTSFRCFRLRLEERSVCSPPHASRVQRQSCCITSGVRLRAGDLCRGVKHTGTMDHSIFGSEKPGISLAIRWQIRLVLVVYGSHTCSPTGLIKGL
jgi:hypothetical protein